MTDDVTPSPSEDEQPDPAEGREPGDGGQEGAEQPERDPVAQREQRLRARAREAEAERDGLRERLARYQRTEIEAVAAEVLANGGDLLAVRPDPAALLDADGAVDPVRVREVAEALAAERPHWRRADADGGDRFVVRGRPKPSKSQPNPATSGWSSVISRPRA